MSDTKETMYSVYDLNATEEDPATGKDKPRVHEIVTDLDEHGNAKRTKSYALYAQQGTEMPMAHALKFLHDPAFRVEDENGEQVKPITKKKEGQIELETDQVVASLDELTTGALFIRCQALPGSDSIKRNSKKELMVKFLVDAAEKKKQVGVSRGSEGRIGEMDSDTLDGLIDLSGQLPAGGNVLQHVNI